MSWHEGERATVAVGLALAALALVVYISLTAVVWDFSTLRTSTGLPLAADFANYWAAAKLALAGQAPLAYNLDELHEVQQQVLGTHHRHGVGWYYPPTYLLLMSPWGLLPYLPAFLTWIIGTLALYLLVLSRLSPHPIALPLLCLFSGNYENFKFGQNGFLTGTLLGGGLLLLERCPLAAGGLFGLLSYKPQFILLIFPALMFGRHWQALAGALAASLLLSLTSLLVFGYQVWLDYFKVMAIPMEQLESGGAIWSIMPTFFAATRSAGFGVPAAYLVQGLVMAAVMAGVAWVWSKKTSLANRGAVLVLGTLLFTPYACIYDLAILALPLGWLWEEGRLHGRLPGELPILLAGWVMPFLATFLWDMINVFQGKLQVGPAVLAALFILSLAKAKNEINRQRINQRVSRAGNNEAGEEARLPA
jgi:hypothetical protein